MARTTRVVLTCDLHDDDTEAVTTVSLVDGGKARAELDLCRAHADELFGAGRRPGRRHTGSSRTKGSGTGRTPKTRRPPSSGPSTTAVREWAVANGHTVSNRGRIPAEVRAAYSDAHAEEEAAG